MGGRAFEPPDRGRVALNTQQVCRLILRYSRLYSPVWVFRRGTLFVRRR